jgi:hypothetical protein
LQTRKQETAQDETGTKKIRRLFTLVHGVYHDPLVAITRRTLKVTIEQTRGCHLSISIRFLHQTDRTSHHPLIRAYVVDNHSMLKTVFSPCKPGIKSNRVVVMIAAVTVFDAQQQNKNTRCELQSVDSKAACANVPDMHIVISRVSTSVLTSIRAHSHV